MPMTRDVFNKYGVELERALEESLNGLTNPPTLADALRQVATALQAKASAVDSSNASAGRERRFFSHADWEPPKRFVSYAGA